MTEWNPQKKYSLDDIKNLYPNVYDGIYNRGYEAGKNFDSRVDGQLKTLASKKANNPSEATPFDERCRAEWDADAALRLEFDNDFLCYRCYREADSRGLVRIAGRKVVT